MAVSFYATFVVCGASNVEEGMGALECSTHPEKHMHAAAEGVAQTNL